MAGALVTKTLDWQTCPACHKKITAYCTFETEGEPKLAGKQGIDLVIKGVKIDHNCTPQVTR